MPNAVAGEIKFQDDHDGVDGDDGASLFLAFLAFGLFWPSSLFGV